MLKSFKLAVISIACLSAVSVSSVGYAGVGKIAKKVKDKAKDKAKDMGDNYKELGEDTKEIGETVGNFVQSGGRFSRTFPLVGKGADDRNFACIGKDNMSVNVAKASLKHCLKEYRTGMVRILNGRGRGREFGVGSHYKCKLKDGRERMDVLYLCLPEFDAVAVTLEQDITDANLDVI